MRTFCRLLALAGATVLFCASAGAEDFPSRYIRVVVGPGPDLSIRLSAPRMTEVLGQQIVIEPRPGAGGVIAAQAVASAPPDGYTLLLASASYTINAALGQMPFDLLHDFAPAALMTSSPFALVVAPQLPVHDLAELIAYAKANPGRLNYASAGVGTPPHLAGELFKSMTGVDIVHLPFREANSALTSVISGNVQMAFSISSVVAPQIASGAVRGIGVTSLKPSRLVPDLPSVAESGLPGFEVLGWNGLLAPAGTPAPVIKKLNAAIVYALADKDLARRFEIAGYDVVASNTPEEFARFIRSDMDKWTGLVKKAGIKIH